MTQPQFTPQQFIDKIAPAAQASFKKYGIAASFAICQAAMETRWGNSDLVREANNLFSIKVSPQWQGETLAMCTGEIIDGKNVVVPALWRKYASWQDSIDDWVSFFQTNERYATAWPLRGDPSAFAKAIQACGYATDPNYAQKIIDEIKARNLTQYDSASPPKKAAPLPPVDDAQNLSDSEAAA